MTLSLANTERVIKYEHLWSACRLLSLSLSSAQCHHYTHKTIGRFPKHAVRPISVWIVEDEFLVMVVRCMQQFGNFPFD